MTKLLQLNKFSIGLTIAAVIAANLSIQFYNSVYFFYGLSLQGTFAATVLIALSTYSASSLGLRLLRRNNYPPSEASVVGFILGFSAFTFVLVVMVALSLRPAYWGRYFWTAAATSFVWREYIQTRRL